MEKDDGVSKGFITRELRGRALSFADAGSEGEAGDGGLPSEPEPQPSTTGRRSRPVRRHGAHLSATASAADLSAQEADAFL